MFNIFMLNTSLWCVHQHFNLKKKKKSMRFRAFSSLDCVFGKNSQLMNEWTHQCTVKKGQGMHDFHMSLLCSSVLQIASEF